jgi:hypothetical protein
MNLNTKIFVSLFILGVLSILYLKQSQKSTIDINIVETIEMNETLVVNEDVDEDIEINNSLLLIQHNIEINESLEKHEPTNEPIDNQSITEEDYDVYNDLLEQQRILDEYDFDINITYGKYKHYYNTEYTRYLASGDIILEFKDGSSKRIHKNIMCKETNSQGVITQISNMCTNLKPKEFLAYSVNDQGLILKKRLFNKDNILTTMEYYDDSKIKNKTTKIIASKVKHVKTDVSKFKHDKTQEAYPLQVKRLYKHYSEDTNELERKISVQIEHYPYTEFYILMNMK